MSKLKFAAIALSAVAVSTSAWAQSDAPAASTAEPAAAPVEVAPPAPAAPADAAAAPAPVGPRVVYTYRVKPPTFSAMSAHNAAFGVIGAMSGLLEGNQLIEEDKIDDPSNRISAELAKAVAADRSATVVERPINADRDNHPDKLIAAAGGAQYIVDVSTYYWGFSYFPFDWTHYAVMYNASVRVIDGATGKLIIKGACHVKPKQTPESPNRDQLLGHEGEGLKKLLAAAGEDCLAQAKAMKP